VIQFKTLIEGINLVNYGIDVTAILQSLGLQFRFVDDYLIVDDLNKQDVELVKFSLPKDVDFEVYINSDEDTDEDTDEPLDFDESTENDTFFIIIFLYNTAIVDKNLTEAKRVIKVNAKGARRIKMQCRKGYKWNGTTCQKISGQELTRKKLAIRKAIRTKKSKGSGFKRLIARKRNKAMKKRKSQGLK